jgi:hypothetical protein
MPTTSGRDRPGQRPTGVVGTLFTVVLLLASLPCGAQEALPPEFEEPSFFIETIAVENAAKFSPDIIVAESLLVEGRSYSESELRDAMYRVKRLPLVLEAEFSLRKGSERGRYELVITVVETRRWFFGLDVDLAVWGDPVSVTGLNTTDSTVGASPLVGRRFSAGRHGIFSLAAGGQEASLQGAYTQHNLFGRSILLNASYGIADCAEERLDAATFDPGDGGCQTEVFDLGIDPTLSSWSINGDAHRLRFNLVIPVRGNHGLRLLSSYRYSDIGIRRQAFTPTTFSIFDDRHELGLNFSWVYNTLDDPLFPSRGEILIGGLDISHLSADLLAFDVPPGRSSALDMRSTQVGIEVSGARYWPQRGDQALSARAEVFVGGSRIDDVPSDDGRVLDGGLGVWRLRLGGGHTKWLKRVRSDRKWKETVWDSEIEALFHGTTPSFSLPDNPRYSLRISSGVSWRNRWGVFRLRLSYVGGQRR